MKEVVKYYVLECTCSIAFFCFTRITMPLFFKFISRKLEKFFNSLTQLSPLSFNLKLVFKYTTTKKMNNPAKLLLL